jgi:2'-5' RNA ligase
MNKKLIHAKRIFIGIRFPRRIAERLFQVDKTLFTELGKRRVKWVDPASLHLTLFFAGYIERNKIEKLKRVLFKVAGDSKRFNLYPNKIGAFPSLKTPKTFWVDVGGEVQALETLAKEIAKQAKKAGLFTEGFFTPHITIAKAKESIEIDWKMVEKANSLLADKQVFTVTQFEMIESRITNKGAIYTTLEKFPIK